MRCNEAHERLHDATYTAARPDDAELAAHLADCADCRAQAERSMALDRVLGLDVPATPSPGFDARFFARLEAQKKVASPRRARAVARRRWGLGIGALTAAAAAAVVVLAVGRGPEALLGDAELAGNLALIMDLELLEDLELVRDLDTVEAYGETFELLAQVDVGELDALLGEATKGVPQ